MVQIDKGRRTGDIKESVYRVEGMHCASCELLIERKLLEGKTVESVEASANKGEVRMEYKGEKPDVKKLNRLFGECGYTFYDRAVGRDEPPLLRFDNQGLLHLNKCRLRQLLVIIGIPLLIISVFIALSRSGLSALLSVNSQSSLPAFFIFGVLAGLSSCAALVGGVVLSMSKQWGELYSDGESALAKFHPHLLFNLGRLVSYAILGAVLGAVGSVAHVSLTLTSALAIGVSVVMILLALQMVGVKALRRFQPTMPKFATRYVADESNFRGRYVPFLMGALTFFLPCGFTLTTQGLALISGSPYYGGLIMLFFALGTLPSLLAIGISSVELSGKPHLSGQFLKIAGVLVLFFAVYNINAQLNVLGLPSLNDLSLGSIWTVKAPEEGLPPVVGGKQVLKMDASAYGYEPNYFKVRAGVPVRWEITDRGTSGCTNAVISKGLFTGQIDLTPGKTSVMEFTAEKPGRYKFSCWMGMVSGVIEVVDSSARSTGSGQAGQAQDSNVAGSVEEIPSGASGCGGGGSGGGCTGGCGGGCGSPGCPYAR